MNHALSLSRSELPEEIATAIENYGHESVVWDASVGPQRRVDAALKALTAAILSRLREAEAENTRLRERLEDKTRSIRVEIAAKLAAYNDLKALEAERDAALVRIERLEEALEGLEADVAAIRFQVAEVRSALTEARRLAIKDA